MADTVVTWFRGLRSAGWRIAKGMSVRQLPIPWERYVLAPTNLRKRGARRRFQLIADSREFRDGWLQECGGDERIHRRFFLRFPNGVWDVPWELLIGELDRERRASVSLVRGVQEGPTALPSRFDRRMSVLVLQGDDGSRTGRIALDLKREFQLLSDVYTTLPSAHRDCISAPTSWQPTGEEFAKGFTNVPDVLFLSGHGSSKPPSFFLVDGSRVTPDQIAAVIGSQAVRPVFAAFWACDTARAPEETREAPGPPFYTAIAQSGVAAVLAMQAAVTDSAAILLAQEVFHGLAAGEALDTAAARARAVLLDALHTGEADSLDWACPVVWSGGLPSVRLVWNSGSSKLAQLQTTSRRSRLRREGRGFSPPTTEEIELARRCTAARLNWISAQDVAEHRDKWVRLITAVQVVLMAYVVAVELPAGGNSSDGLRQWAEEVQQSLEIPDAPGDEFRLALELIRTNPVEGWEKLCSLPNAIVSVWRPPPYGEDDWFWGPLRETANTIIAASEVSDDAVITDGWAVEELAMTVNQDVLDAAYAEARAVAEAMSLLDSPVPRSSIEALGIPLLKLPRLESLAVSTGGEEVVLAASAARFFRSKLNASSTAEAHRACLFILGHASFSGRLTVVLREQRLTHSLGAHESAAAVAEAEALLWKYRQLDRPLAVVSLIQRIGALWRELPEDVLIVPAWAYTVLADLTQAKFWLDRASPSEPLERAWQHGLKAEIHKAEGQKQAALDEINSAIEQLATVPREQFTPLMARRLRAYRQDRARILQYLFYDLAHATDEYAQLLSEWQNDDDAAIDVAIVLRNYSECVRTGHAVGGREWQQGKDMVERATRMMQERQDHPVFAEIAYEQARIAIAEHSPEAAAVLESASIVAAKSGHLMLVAICAARHFWELEDFDVARWRDIESGLVAFPRHGWAVRTLINGRLRAAKRVADKTLVREWMAKNLQALRENPAFNAGSDRFRIAASFAGYSLALTGGDADRKWQEFLQIEWAAVWLSENGSTSAQDVWGRA